VSGAVLASPAVSRAHAWAPILLACWLIGCEKSEPAGGSDDSGAKKSREALTAEYKAMKPPARLDAARSACYVGPDCAGHEAQALLDAADSDAERDALRSAARSGLAGQLQTRLAAKAKQPVSVVATGVANMTLFVRGICSRFVIEDFVGGPEKKQAKALGFSRIECSEAALTAAADL
jgi:hypothetical protein